MQQWNSHNRIRVSLLLAVFLLLVLVFKASGQQASQSDNIIMNLTFFPAGGGNVTSDTVYGNIHLGEWLAGTGSGGNDRFGYFTTTNKTFSIAGHNMTIYIWNGTVYRSHFNISFECAISSFCEPEHQNASLNNASVRRGIMNLTNTGTNDISTIDFKINATCPWINLTFSNSTNLTKYPRQTANTTFKTLWSNLSQELSFDFFLWANFSTPTVGCEIETRFQTT